MLVSTAEFELVPQFVLCVVTLAGVLVVFAAVSGIFLLGRYLFGSGSMAIEKAMRTVQIMTTAGSAGGEIPLPSWRFVYLAPLAIFLGLVIVLAWGMSHDPRAIPTALVGKPVPQFSLPPVKGRTLGLASGDLNGEVSLVNVFASWCTACREEHPVFMKLEAEGIVPIHGLNYKDRPDDAMRWLNAMGDPYTRTGADIDGRTAIEWGVYGVPETFVITKDGEIAHKHIGAMTPKAFEETVLPLIQRLRQQ